MSNNTQLKYVIQSALEGFASKSLAKPAINLFEVLGYRSEKRFELSPNNAKQFQAEFDPKKKLNAEKALVASWSSVDVLFQLTDDEIQSFFGQPSMFGSNKTDQAIINSYLFFAIELKEREKPYTRTELATITREVNGLFLMPVLILFRHGDTISLSIIRRRINKNDNTRDVLEKVTLIKDIRWRNPLRAHIEILADFHLGELDKEFRAQNFVQLHSAWERRLGTYTLNERFYRDIANWYFAALQDKRIIYPRSVENDQQRSMFLIRLLTRLIFCWFLQEKDLIASEVFSRETARKLLKDFSPEAGTYYRAILQNLFFATLNQPQKEREYRHKNPNGRDGNRGVTSLYRYADLFKSPAELPALFKEIPFLNGGLFECLDTPFRKEEKRVNIRFDDFSEEKENKLYLPNTLFFEEQGHEVDLSKVYDDARKRRETTKGLIDILDSYKFTIEENTPLEEEIALDPELLGKVFENLLASYNDETQTTARKATGSFYTPREIVSYMVDETLLAYLRENTPEVSESDLRDLFAAAPQNYKNTLKTDQTVNLIAALDNVRVLDPACGSGAFPMGVLQRMVDLLAKLDPNNFRWKQQQLDKAERDLTRAEAMEDENIRKAVIQEATARIEDIQHSFDTRHHELDFARKLYLIENCIYGVDIQPVAIQIAKLRFFITLVVDQKTDRRAENQGVRPLPNLETKLVAADSLFPLPRPKEAMMSFGDYAVKNLREELRQVRHEYFRARTPEKKTECRNEDKRLRKEIAKQLRANGWDMTAAQKLADWDPYDPNAEVPDFLEPEWMFGGLSRPTKPGPVTLRGAFSFVNEAGGQMELTSPTESTGDEWRFDIVIGNPPYVRQEQIKHLKSRLQSIYECYVGTADLFVYFYERGIKLLRPNGAFSFITSNKWMRSAYGEKLRIWLNKNTHLRQLIDFGDEPVFTAIAYPCIVVLTRNDLSIAEQKNENVTVLNWKTGWDTTHFTETLNRHSFKIPQFELSNGSWQIAGQTERKLLEKLEKFGQTLGTYTNNRIYRGITTGSNEAFIIDEATRDKLVTEHPSASEIIKPLLRGKDVKRWAANYSGLYLCFVGWNTPIENFPSIHRHLKQFQDILKTRPEVKDKKFPWYAMSRYASAYWQEFEIPKIYFPSISNNVNFAADEKGYYGNNKTNILVSPDLYSTLAILNSSVSWWVVRQRFQTKQGGFYEFLPATIPQLPIPPVKDSQRTSILQIVSCIMELIQNNKSEQNRISAFESLLNGLVYELFFPNELEAAKIRLFDFVKNAYFPNLKSLQAGERLSAIYDAHDTIFMGDHPIRSALFNLRGLEIVRVIEAEETNKPTANYEITED